MPAIPASFATALWQGGAVVALGGVLFLWRAGAVPAPLQAWAAKVWRALGLASVLALLAGLLVIAADAQRILESFPGNEWSVWRTLLSATRLGQMWLVKQAMLLTLVSVFLAARPSSRTASVAAVAATTLFFAAGAFAGHGGVSEPLKLFLPLHAAHALLAAAWLGALPVWASLLRRAGDTPPEHRYLVDALNAFSRFALLAMLLLVTSGTLVAWRQFGSWPAVFATTAGAWLCLKLAALAVALVSAWHLRQVLLPRLAHGHDAVTRRAAERAFGVEMLAALVVFIMALQLAHTTPAAHQALHWWLPFRLLPELLTSSSLAQWQLTVALALLLCVLPAWLMHYRRLAPCLLLAAVALGTQAVTVRAFPSTYARPAVPYEAESIDSGLALYARHCTACHGAGGRGDGPDSLRTPVPPADLARHTGAHSAGDMFAWISDGTPNAAMPGFRAVLGENERWDLVNLLRAFADGHRARVLTMDISPRRPWLAAPNFHFQASDGRRGELKAWRGERAVLLILAKRGALRAYARVVADSGAALEVLVAPLDGECDTVAARHLDCMARDGTAVAATYGIFTRSLNDAGDRQQLAPAADDAVFLIDRFGYLRARWLPGDAESPWPPARLRIVVEALAAEPAIRPAPETHVH